MYFCTSQDIIDDRAEILDCCSCYYRYIQAPCVCEHAFDRIEYYLPPDTGLCVCFYRRQLTPSSVKIKLFGCIKIETIDVIDQVW